MMGMPTCYNGCGYGYNTYTQGGYGYPQMGGGYPPGYGMQPGYGAPPGYGASYPTTDPSSAYMSSMCMGLIQQMMGQIFSMISSGRSGGAQGGTNGSGGSGGTNNNHGSSGSSSNNHSTKEPSSPDSNTEALELLEKYADDLPAGRNGRLDREALEDFANGKSDAPKAVKEAARMISENEELYNLLCLQSGNDPDEGIDKDLFEDGDWDDIDAELDEMKTFKEGKKGDKDAIEELQEQKDKIAALSGDSNDISVEDLKKIALGEEDLDLDDDDLAKLQAAALRILSDEDLLEDLEEFDDDSTSTAPNDTKSGSFNKNAFQEWLSAHA